MEACAQSRFCFSRSILGCESGWFSFSASIDDYLHDAATGLELVYYISVLRHAQKCDRQDSRYSSSLTRWRALCVICAALSATMAILSTPLQESRRRHSDLPSFYAFSDTADTKRSSGALIMPVDKAGITRALFSISGFCLFKRTAFRSFTSPAWARTYLSCYGIEQDQG